VNKRVFISSAADDLDLRDSLVGQARQGRAPVQFVDYAVKEAWDNVWKTNCRMRITGCDGLIAIVTPKTPRTSSQLWEISCAKAEAIAVLLISPPWSWPEIAAFLERL
jgi:hypothetical protein